MCVQNKQEQAARVFNLLLHTFVDCLQNTLLVYTLLSSKLA